VHTETWLPPSSSAVVAVNVHVAAPPETGTETGTSPTRQCPVSLMARCRRIQSSVRRTCSRSTCCRRRRPDDDDVNEPDFSTSPATRALQASSVVSLPIGQLSRLSVRDWRISVSSSQKRRSIAAFLGPSPSAEEYLGPEAVLVIE